MFQKFVLLGIFVGGCASLPAIYLRNADEIERWYWTTAAEEPATQAAKPPAKTAAIAVVPVAPPASGEDILLGRKVLVRADPRGHFVAQFKLNGRATEALVDTGATVIAINRSTARRIGISLANIDFKYEVRTANGVAKAAAVVIDRVQIGRISLENIEAMVLEDKALEGVLVGMSFLNRLSKFQVQDGALVMQQ
jgi:aspartyl protease family protein